jgi:hypothetical protein
VWHVKEPSLIKYVSAKHRSKIAALSPVMVIAARAEKIAPAAKNKQTNKQTRERERCYTYLVSNKGEGACTIRYQWEEEIKIEDPMSSK